MAYPMKDGKLDIVREEVITPKKGTTDKPDMFRQPVLCDFYYDTAWYVDMWGHVRKVGFTHKITPEGGYSDIRVKGQQSAIQRKPAETDNSPEACRIRAIWTLMGM